MDILENFFTNDKCNDYYKSVNNNENLCAICYTQLDDYNKVTLDCKHIYHEKCINNLLSQSHYFNCPYCKSYQAKYKLIDNCLYITKNLKSCSRICLTDNKICTFHHKYMKKNNKCMGICLSGKKCEHKRINGSIFCKKHQPTDE